MKASFVMTMFATDTGPSSILWPAQNDPLHQSREPSKRPGLWAQAVGQACAGLKLIAISLLMLLGSPLQAQTPEPDPAMSASANASTSAPPSAPERARVPNPKDPFESFNRAVSGFNDRVDEALLQPVARTYVKVTPELVQTGVKNFFGNLSDIWSTVNNALQLKPQETVESLARVGVNTILGVGGVIDWASKMGIDRHTEDFGQTLGHWGVGSGPYLVLPFMGPSTLRDTLSLTMDFNGSPTRRVKPVAARYELLGLNLVSKRAQYLGLGDELNDLALDRYSFLRDVYLQKRLSDVWDGNPPEDKEEGDTQGQPGALAPEVEVFPAQAALSLDTPAIDPSP